MINKPTGCYVLPATRINGLPGFAFSQLAGIATGNQESADAAQYRAA
ncbi:hypothetical protein [Citrobacter amalonaticus]|nr:hypothetical protein [Citrobacter amalonaticus]